MYAVVEPILCKQHFPHLVADDHVRMLECILQVLRDLIRGLPALPLMELGHLQETKPNLTLYKTFL